MTCGSVKTIERLERELREVDDEIDRLYWAFTRQARAKPPVVANPKAYERRRALLERLRSIR